MARIQTSGTADDLRVRVAGRLTMKDMGRLEHACGPALVSHPMRLELDLRAVTSLDATARAVIGCFTARGATVIANMPVPSTAIHRGRRKRDGAQRIVT